MISTKGNIIVSRVCNITIVHGSIYLQAHCYHLEQLQYMYCLMKENEAGRLCLRRGDKFSELALGVQCDDCVASTDVLLVCG